PIPPDAPVTSTPRLARPVSTVRLRYSRVGCPARPPLVRGLRPGRHGRRAGRHAPGDRVAPGPGPPARTRVPRARRGPREHLRPARPRLVVRVQRRPG